MTELDPPPLLVSGGDEKVVGGSIRPDDLRHPLDSVNHGLIEGWRMKWKEYSPQVRKYSLMVCLMLLISNGFTYIIFMSFHSFWPAYTFLATSLILAFFFFTKVTVMIRRELPKKRS